MRSMKNSYLRYIAVALVIVFLISAAFLILDVWEGKQGKFPEASTQDGVVTYKNQDYTYKDDIETFLLLGLDKFDGAETADSHDSGVQTDFLMLFVFDNEKKQSTAIQINRDTMTNVNRLSVGGATVVESYIEQIALAYNYANAENDKIRCRNTKDSVEYLLKDINVDHYLALTMDAVPVSCDLVGGVEVTVLDDFTSVDAAMAEGEKITLTGEQAFRYVRTRQGLEDSTNTARMARQQQYLDALYDKFKACINADEGFAVRFADAINEYIVYDSSDQKMMQFAEKFDDYEFLGIKEIKGQTKRGEEFVEFYPDEESVWDIVIDLFYQPKTDEVK